MKTNRPDLAEEVEKQYGLTCTVEKDNLDSSTDYEITIEANGRVALLHEHMKNGLTKHVVLTTDHSMTYKKYHEAEEDAVAYLKG